MPSTTFLPDAPTPYASKSLDLRQSLVLIGTKLVVAATALSKHRSST